jgi:hypothetical protein
MAPLDKARRYIETRKALWRAGRAAAREIAQGRSEAHLGADVGARAVGRLTIQMRRADQVDDPDAWVTIEDDDNLVVQQAEILMAQMAIGAVNSQINYIELGDPAFPANPPALSDIALQQTTGQRKTATVTASGNVLRAEALWTTVEGNGFVYTEAGLYTGLLGAGSLFARKAFSPITKTASYQMRYVWHVTFLINTGGGDCAGVALIGPTTVSSSSYWVATGGEASVAAGFDFSVGSNLVDVFLNRQRLYPLAGGEYTEAAAGALTPPTLGPAGNKGVNLNFGTLNPGDRVLLVHRALT